MISPMIFYLIITGFIGAFKAYSDVVAIFGTDLNAAGMNTIVGYIYDMLYGSSGGYPSFASAAAIVLFVCKDFESYFVEQVLKSMEKMAKIDSDDEDSNLFTSMAGIGGTEDTSLNTLGSYFGDEMVSSYAKLMTNSGNGKGLGIAQTLYEQMKRNYSTESIPKADGQE